MLVQNRNTLYDVIQSLLNKKYIISDISAVVNGFYIELNSIITAYN